MPHRKVYAAAAQNDDPHEVVVATEDPAARPRTSLTAVEFEVPRSTLKTASKLSSRSLLKVCRRLYRRGSRPVSRLYKRLPWTTRQTINLTISLYAALYIFLTVPFRIAFYYNPFQHEEQEGVHRWTEELSIFTPLDLVADVIGLVEFIGFYRVWRTRSRSFRRR